jgi:hypothetical protein
MQAGSKFKSDVMEAQIYERRKRMLGVLFVLLILIVVFV